MYSGHKHNYERTYPLKDSNAVSASYHNSPSFLQVITGNAGNHEGPESFTEAEVPSWLGHRYEGYGFTSLQVSPQFLDIQHIEANVDGSFGNIIDQVRLSKSTSHVNKQKIVSH
jgi:hypothetical protein